MGLNAAKNKSRGKICDYPYMRISYRREICSVITPEVPYNILHCSTNSDETWSMTWIKNFINSFL